MQVLAVDLTSVFLVTRAVIPHMRARGRGCIVSVSSIAGKEGTPRLIPYSVAKAGIIAFTKALGKEVVAEGIRVNCVAPGVVQTAAARPASAGGDAADAEQGADGALRYGGGSRRGRALPRLG